MVDLLAIYCIDHCGFSRMLTTRVENERFIGCLLLLVACSQQMNWTELNSGSECVYSINQSINHLIGIWHLFSGRTRTSQNHIVGYE